MAPQSPGHKHYLHIFLKDQEGLFYMRMLVLSQTHSQRLILKFSFGSLIEKHDDKLTSKIAAESRKTMLQ